MQEEKREEVVAEQQGSALTQDDVARMLGSKELVIYELSRQMDRLAKENKMLKFQISAMKEAKEPPREEL